MTIDRFSKERFEQVIAPYGDHTCAFSMGEFVYTIPLDAQVSIRIRSSIGASEIADEAGQDSIRLNLICRQDNSYLGKLDGMYITRVPGWEVRLGIKFATLSTYRRKAGDCPDCRMPLKIHVSTTLKNPNRPFAKCDACEKFFWIDRIQHPQFFDAPVALSAPKRDADDVLAELGFSSEPAPQLEPPKTGEMGSVFDALDEDAVPEEHRVEIVSVSDSTAPDAQQAEFIFAPLKGAYRVIAGPGSGKTFTIKHRYKFMVDCGVDPDRIIVATFNTKMASEVRSKIMSLVPMIENRPASNQICTIHAFCFRMLKAYGVLGTVEVVDGRTLWKMKKIYENALQEIYPQETTRPLWKEAADWIATAKSDTVTPVESEGYFGRYMSDFYARTLSQVYREVDHRMSAQGLITFSDMLFRVDLLCKMDPAFVAHLRSRFDYVIVDEAQDTSAQAMRILTTITDNFTAVGDTDQLLYRFAGATPEANLQEGFEEIFPENTMFKLETNYRSTRTIVNAARMIHNNYMEAGGPYENHYKKYMTPHTKDIGQIDFQSFTSPLDEANFVAQTIERMIQGHSDYPKICEQVFIGMRTRAYSVYYEDALARHNIPFINTTGVSFWSQSHVTGLISYLKVLINAHDRDAFAKVYNIPSSGWVFPWQSSPQYGQYVNSRILSKEFLNTYPTYGDAYQAYSRMYSVMNKFRPALLDLIQLVEEARADLQEDGVVGALRYFIANSLKPYLEAEYGPTETQDGDGGKLDDLASVLEMASQFQKAEDFIRYVDMLISASQAKKEDDWSGKVVISTIHRLKGLERDFVFAVGVSQFNPATSKGVTSLLPHTFTFAEPIQQGKLPVGGGCRFEDERCLYFVLITRARRKVWVCSPLTYRNDSMQPSDFVTETLRVLGEE
jgi:DNA helicase II / ATP-dependent DNA helicase PcrA